MAGNLQVMISARIGRARRSIASALALVLLPSQTTLPATAANLDKPAEASNPQVQVCPDGGYQSGCDRESIENAIVVEEDWAATLTIRCLYRSRAPCVPLATGRIELVEQGRPLTWQLVALHPKDGPRTEMLILVEGIEQLDRIILSTHQTDGWFSPPELVQNSAALMIVHAAGRYGGSGGGNADILLSRHEQGWTTFDVNALLDEASAMLPPGFRMAAGVDFDFRHMLVAAPVKRSGDGGCCATGGTAFVDFEMPGGNALQVASVRFEETAPVKTHRHQR
ncbi:hypothetical protein [Blastomonas sp. AAP53]|uniref:hypothetical protein n=1 Tax=Blastomonas sp. AAP53 TaxID=1248760 RepID=UPI00187C70BC|nr:hypothetical protein [Blastomonas sp. AAP53]